MTHHLYRIWHLRYIAVDVDSARKFAYYGSWSTDRLDDDVAVDAAGEQFYADHGAGEWIARVNHRDVEQSVVD